ncbi:hypothetical protein CEXT_142521 [Caerostris extrusa]|uniref:Uncharacterized protein n=1 Tax=Caerostris extrusa TaxID=172846 RepID=A0AAV4UL79_CAEEX|nr:hypothetical protein CEXT_142521 [Caerostris extrusa]
MVALVAAKRSLKGLLCHPPPPPLASACVPGLEPPPAPIQEKGCHQLSFAIPIDPALGSALAQVGSRGLTTFEICTALVSSESPSGRLGCSLGRPSGGLPRGLPHRLTGQSFTGYISGCGRKPTQVTRSETTPRNEGSFAQGAIWVI